MGNNGKYFARSDGCGDPTRDLPEGIRWPRAGIDLTDPALNPEQTGQAVPHAGVQEELIAAYWLCSWMDVYALLKQLAPR
jgi:hypothetical protein